MKNLVLMISMIISLAAFGADMNEYHFDHREEGKCRQEIMNLGCGTPSKNDGAFMKCVDSKIANLSQSCQSMHQSKEKMRASFGR